MPNKTENIIELKNLTKSYEDGFVAVDDFNLEIKRGEFVTFLGPSGCGKTTTLRMIAGFDLPTAGEILLNGEDITKLPPHKRPINTVFQRYALFPHMNIYENIAFGLQQKKTSKDVISKKVKKFLKLVDLEGFENRKVSTLSGGQQQRVAIARALATNPEVIYFDEPTSALDPELIGEVLSVMRTLADEGMTMVIVTHEVNFARNVSSKVIFMEDGAVLEAGPTRAFFENPKEARTKEFLRTISARNE